MTFLRGLRDRRLIAPATLVSCAIFSFNLNIAYAQGHRALVRVDTAKLRSGPGEQHKPKALLNGGRAARVLKRSGGWVHLRLESGTEGWVRSDLLAISKAKAEAKSHHKKSHGDSEGESRRSRRARERQAAREAEREEVRRQARRADARRAAIAEIKAEKRATAHAEARSRAKAAKLQAIAKAKNAAKMKQLAKAKSATSQQKLAEETLKRRMVLARLSADAAAALKTVSAPKSIPTATNSPIEPQSEKETPTTQAKPESSDTNKKPERDTPPKPEATIDLPIVEEVIAPVVVENNASPAAKRVPDLTKMAPAIRQRIGAALTSRGIPYRFGATGHGAFDCSAFTRFIFSKSGVGLPRTAAEQYTRGIRVPKDQLQPGDLVFFKNTYKHGVSHVGMYLGSGKFIHASSGAHQVAINDLSASYYVHHWAGARRPR